MENKEINSKVNSETSHLDMGKFYFLNNNIDEAVAEFKKVLEINPVNAEAYYNLGLISESGNKIDEAKELYARALNINPSYKIAREKLEKLIGL
ncbi:MAG: tetratricopeptide repeat protein [Endomicrobium sp.]|jgi:tetratricopeptide (TPR) repeat protein|nr:tetratricopeptide repeat protein [Endomicrobium sp.]